MNQRVIVMPVRNNAFHKRFPIVVYWVNTAIKRGTQENETKMAEQPVLIKSRDLVSYQIWRGQSGTQGTQSNNFLPSKL